LLPQVGQVATLHDDCRLDVLTRSKLERPLRVLGEFGAITSGMQHARNSGSELNLLRYNQNALSHCARSFAQSCAFASPTSDHGRIARKLEVAVTYLRCSPRNQTTRLSLRHEAPFGLLVTRTRRQCWPHSKRTPR